MPALGDTATTSISLALAFELAMHVFVHYTVPGAQFASWLAQSLAPGLDAIGLTSVFSSTAGGGAAAAGGAYASLPSLGALVPSTG